MNDYEGARGSGADTPDQAIARKAAADVLAGRAKDKEAGLAQGKQASFGGLGRLFQGNIDAPGSEASSKYGAGAGATIRRAANTPVEAPVAPVVSAPIVSPNRVIQREMDDMPNPVSAAGVKLPNRDIQREMDDMGASTPVAKPKNRIVSKAELAKSGMSLRDFLNKERGLKRRPDTTDYEAALKSVAKGKATRESDMRIDSRKKGGSIKAYASGGSVSSRADGCAQRGKTKGMMR